MQTARRSDQGNQCLEVICLPQVRESLEAVAEVRELLNRKLEENALIVARLVIWHLTAPTCVRCGKVGHTSRNCELTPRFSTVEKLGIPLETVFTPRD